MDLVYIILAAGLSERFKSKNNNIEKQFYLINEKSILEICIENFLELNLIINYLLLFQKPGTMMLLKYVINTI